MYLADILEVAVLVPGATPDAVLALHLDSVDLAACVCGAFAKEVSIMRSASKEDDTNRQRPTNTW